MPDPSPIFCDRSEDLADALAAVMPRPTAIVGVGNPLRGDDGFGPAVVSALRPSSAIRLFDVQAVPESYLVPIVKSNCPGILFVDAADYRLQSRSPARRAGWPSYLDIGALQFYDAGRGPRPWRFGR